MSHPSEGTTIPDDLYFAAEGAGGTPQSKREALVRAVTVGPVEQQLVNIAGELYDVKRSVEKLEEKLDKRMDSLENLLRGFIVQTQDYFERPRGT